VKLARFQRSTFDMFGQLLVGASILVESEKTGAQVQIFSDRNGETGIDNPTLSDADGDVSFYAAGEALKITATLGDDSKILRHFALGTAGEYDADHTLFLEKAQFTASATPGAGEALPFYAAAVGMTILAGLPNAIGGLVVAPQNDWTISWMLNGVEFATMTIDAGEFDATFDGPADDIELVRGDRIWPVMPDPRDAFAAGFSATIFMRR